ncbi:PLP-dependent aminotransferase family protein [Acetobacterium bakii]|uniref:GntR family transcriptional regulator n=1 Tax=Acetobacterium bakii TaxID=52689 RepID=A0A0L6U1U1_9FIRM|nr:PLP-dependent aminotransferase family protein [Acetobacterium bakii]KNZ42312.1 GntR family transcriptional regulator [Acetobacterium bakii]
MSINSFENYPMSWKPKKAAGNERLCVSLVRQLEEDIKTGVLLPGTRLPPQRELADYLDINVSTVSRAFKECTQKGLLSSTVGSGTFVAYDATANLCLLPSPKTRTVIEMGSVFPEAVAYKEITGLIEKMITEPDFGILFQYGPTEGTSWHKDAAVKLIAQAGYQTTPDKLLPTNGGQNAIAVILSGLFHPGDRIGTDPLTYTGIKTVAKMLGIQLIPIRQKNGEMSADGILYACKNENIKGLYIMPDFQNPTTHSMSDSGRQAIGEIAREKKLIVLEDVIYSLLNQTPKNAVASYAPDQTIYIASLSKVFAPGLRLAYMVSPEQYKKDLVTAMYNINLSVSPFLSEIASRMIVSKNADRLIENRRQLTRVRNQLIDEALSGYRVLGSADCIFRWLLLPKGITGNTFESLAQAAGVQVYAAERFAVGNVKPVAAVRLAVGAANSNDELLAGLEIIGDLLKKADRK